MLQPREKRSANDNAPLGRAPNGRRLLRPNPTPAHAVAREISNSKIGPVIDWLIPLAAVVAGGVALIRQIPLPDLYWPSLILGALLLLSVTISKARPQLRNISSLLMVLAFTTALAAFLSANGLTLIGVELFLTVSIFALLAGWAFKSNASLLLSAFAGLLYLTNFFPELGLLTGISEDSSQLGVGIFPWLVLGQILLAHKVKSSIVLFSAVTAGYIWLASATKSMPLEHMAGFGFVIAAAHYWFGKAREENEVFGAEIHKFCAWVFAIGTALFIQSIWLNVDTVQAKPYGTPNSLWWTVLAIASVTLFVISLQRYKASHISLLGIFVISAAALLLPATMVEPASVYSAFDSIPGLNAHPGLGYVIGASLIAAGFYWLIDGLASGKILEMSMGGIVIGLQSMVLLKPENYNLDLGVVFIVSLICALCIGGLVAGVSANRQQAVDNYA